MKISLWSVFTLSVLLSGCVAYTQQPLSDPATAVIDATLIGTWHSTGEDGEKLEVTIAADGEHMVSIRYQETKEDGHLHKLSYRAHSSEIGGKHYLNVIEPGPTLASRGYLIVKYSTATENTLDVSLIDEDAVKAAIRNSEIPGMIEVTSKFNDATITAEPGQVADLLARSDAVLFPRTLSFQRAP